MRSTETRIYDRRRPKYWDDDGLPAWPEPEARTVGEVTRICEDPEDSGDVLDRDYDMFARSDWAHI